MCSETKHCTGILMHNPTVTSELWFILQRLFRYLFLFFCLFKCSHNKVWRTCTSTYTVFLFSLNVHLTNCFPFFSLLVLCRDVGYGRRYFSGTLEAAVVGKWHTVLPCVHDWVRASSPDDTTHSPGACSCPTWTHASAAHLSYGKLWPSKPKKCACGYT